MINPGALSIGIFLIITLALTSFSKIPPSFPILGYLSRHPFVSASVLVVCLAVMLSLPLSSIVGVVKSGTSPTSATSNQQQQDDDRPLEERMKGGPLAKAMFSRRAEYLDLRSCVIKVGTWNIAATPYAEKEVGKWLVDDRKKASSSSARKSKGDSSSKTVPVKWLQRKIDRRTNKPMREDVIEDDDEGEVGMYVIGLQEVVDITSADSFLRGTDPNVKKRWEDAIAAALPSYICIATQQLIGVLVFVYVSPKLAPQITTPSVTSVGTGVMGYVGNKGAAMARLILGGLPAAGISPPPVPYSDSEDVNDPLEDQRGLTLVLIASHLAAVANATERRNWDFAEIGRRAYFHPKPLTIVGGEGDQENEPPGGYPIHDSDIIIWLGDLNYRIELPNNEIRQVLQPFMPPEADGSAPKLTLAGTEGPTNHAEETDDEAEEEEIRIPKRNFEESISYILSKDQLREQQRTLKAFQYYHEGAINFLPTYKYDQGTISTFDSSEKMRIPSYCDRILWKERAVALAEQHKARADDLAHERDKKREDIITKGDGSEVLFDLGSDGGGDDGEESEGAAGTSTTEAAEGSASAPLASVDGHEAKLSLISYDSHQSITASDHKPVTAVFKLEYVACLADERAKVHAEIVKDLDRNENDMRPVVTMIIDDDRKGSGIAEFGEIRWGERKRLNVTVANTGRSTARCDFVKRPILEEVRESVDYDGFQRIEGEDATDDSLAFGGDDDEDVINPDSPPEAVSKPWLWAYFASRKSDNSITLEPGDAENITLEISLPPRSSIKNPKPYASLLRRLNTRRLDLEDVVILRVSDGPDLFIPVKADFKNTFLGYSMADLLRVPDSAGGIRKNWKCDDNVNWSSPRELFRMTELLLTSLKTIVESEGAEGVRWTTLPGWPFVPDTWGLGDTSRDRTGDEAGNEEWGKGSANARTALKQWFREALDTDAEWNWDEAESVGYTLEDRVEVAAETLIEWLKYLKESVVPESAYPEIIRSGSMQSGADKILDSLHGTSGSNVHGNVFIYLTSFISEVISVLTPNAPQPGQPTNPSTIPSSPTKSRSKLTTAELVENNVLTAFAAVIVRRPKSMGKLKRGEVERVCEFLKNFTKGK